MPNTIDSGNNQAYYSMMGLIKEDDLKGLYKPDGGWTSFRDMQDVLGHMEKAGQDGQDGCAIPDIYGRALQNGILLKESDRTIGIYPDNQEIRAWRGILAIIALQDYLELPLRLDCIQYRGGKHAFDKALQQPMDVGMFDKAVGFCNDRYYMLTWKRPGEERGDDIGFFSPLTLVCPMANLSGEAPVAQVHWFNGKAFQDPVVLLDDVEKSIVLYWLSKLKETVSGWDNEEGSRQKEWQNMILRHILRYIKDLENNINVQYKGKKNCFSLKPIQEDMQDGVVDSVLNKTVSIQFRFNENTTEEAEISYREFFSQKILCAPGAENSFSGCAYADKYKVINSSRLFTFVPMGKRVQDKLSRVWIEQLVECFEIREEKGNAEGSESCFIARYALSNLSAEWIDIKRKYTKDDYFSERLPVMAVWPPSDMPEWGKRYVYLEGGINLTIDGGNAGKNPYVKRFDNMPITIPLMRKTGKGKFEELGMVLPKMPRERAKGVPGAVVGIDFGTSKTVVSYKIGSEPTEIIDKLQDTSEMLIKPCEDGTQENSIRLATMGDYFVPYTVDKQLLYSIFRRPTLEPLTKADPILDGIIYRAGKDEEIKREEIDLFIADIKWDDRSRWMFYVPYIEELCMHIWLLLQKKGVHKVEWRYALPGSIDNKEIIKMLWGKNIQPFLKDITTDETGEMSFSEAPYSESIAASMYFLSYKYSQDINRRQGYLVVDIGGGSTDIALWKQDDVCKMQMVAHTSIPVAGRVLFTRFIALNLGKIIGTIQNGELEKKLRYVNENSEWAKENQVMYNSLLEQIIQGNLSDIEEAYIDAEWAPDFRRQIEFGFAMLFFSLGSLVGQKLAENVLPSDSLEGNFTIAVGGYGSKILDWLEGSEEKLLGMFQDGVLGSE